jgi:hypothetical protein
MPINVRALSKAIYITLGCCCSVIWLSLQTTNPAAHVDVSVLGGRTGGRRTVDDERWMMDGGRWTMDIDHGSWAMDDGSHISSSVSGTVAMCLA